MQDVDLLQYSSISHHYFLIMWGLPHGHVVPKFAHTKLQKNQCEIFALQHLLLVRHLSEGTNADELPRMQRQRKLFATFHNGG